MKIFLLAILSVSNLSQAATVREHLQRFFQMCMLKSVPPAPNNDILDALAANRGADDPRLKLKDRIYLYSRTAAVDPKIAKATSNLVDGANYFFGNVGSLTGDMHQSLLFGRSFLGLYDPKAPTDAWYDKERWMQWHTPHHKKGNRPLHKVYLTIPPDIVKRDLRMLAEEAEKAGADGLKVSVAALEMPDRVVVHFVDVAAADAFAAKMHQYYYEQRVKGDHLTFTERVGAEGSPVYRASDLGKSAEYPRGNSWRMHVATVIARASTEFDAAPVGDKTEYIKRALREANIDPDRWRPLR